MTGDPTPIPYATLAPKPPGRAWAGTAIVIGGLVLVGLAGCFLIGVMSVLTPSPLFNIPSSPAAPLTESQLVFVTVLYVFAFASMSGGTIMLVVGVKSLLRLMIKG